MYLVRETRDASGASYTVTDGSKVTTVRTRCLSAELDTEGGGGRTVFVFYDSEHRILYAPSVFLETEMRWDSDNTRLQAVSALKLLMSFSAIIGTYPQDFDVADARAFLQFARGTLGDGFDYSFELQSKRSEATVAAYLTVARRYVAFLGADKSPFFLRKARRRPLEGKPDERDYVIAARTVDSGEAPFYVSTEEYERILATIEADWGIEEECIVRLMYEHGLRVGEVLGLTAEDMKMKVCEGAPSYSVTLRNRASDGTDQRAKTLMKISTPEQYGTAEYRKRNVGFQEVFITETLYHNIIEYLEDSQQLFAGQSSFSNCRADSVEDTDENRYVFANAKGRRLTASLWGRRLRAIFAASGVHVDEGVRKTNLNHRLRHGYAMFLIRDAGLSSLEVKVLMRHRSLRSTEVYSRPTEKDVHDLQDLVMARMHAALFGGGEGE